MKERLSALATAVLVACAVVITGLNLKHEFFGRTRASGAADGVAVRNWRAIAGEADRAAPAEVEVVVFSDYTCHFCRQLEGALDSLTATFGAAIGVRHHHFPLEQAGVGFRAAVAYECAAAQQRGPTYHRLLFAYQPELGTLGWDSLAALAGVPDRPAFGACVREQRTADAVRRDRMRGQALGIAGTPAYLINGRFYVGGASFAELVERVRRAPRGNAAR